MSLINHLKGQVDNAIRNRGWQYYQQKRVRIGAGDAWQVSASVQGSSMYDISLHRDEDALVMRCDCPYFQGSLDACKHIWATLLAAEQRGFLQGDGNNNGIFLDVDEDAENDPADEEFFEDEEDFDRGNQPFVGQDTLSFVRKKLQRLGLAAPPRKSAGKSKRAAKKPPIPAWQRQLNELKRETKPLEDSDYTTRPTNTWLGRELLYVIEVAESIQQGKLILSMAHRQPKQNGEWSKPKLQSIEPAAIARLGDPADRAILALLAGPSALGQSSHYYGGYSPPVGPRFTLACPLAETLLPMISATGRFLVRPDAEHDLLPLTWDDGPPWQFLIQVRLTPDAQHYEMAGVLRRGDDALDLKEPNLVTDNVVICHGRTACLQFEGNFHWIAYFREHGVLSFPAADKKAWLRQLLSLPQLPNVELPPDLEVLEVSTTPRCCLRVQPIKDHWLKNRLEGKLFFDYAGERIDPRRPGPVFNPETNQLFRRDENAEVLATVRLKDAGFTQRNDYYNPEPRWELLTKHLPRVVSELLKEGWHVEAEGKLYRNPGVIDIEVRTGIDWFELHGTVRFDDKEVSLPELLKAVKKGQNTVVLGDGSLGMLPEDWLKKYGVLAGLGKAEDDKLKFARNQAGLLDALLASQPEARCDDAFSKVRKELARFDGIAPANPPKSFQGELRGYQAEGLGWLGFLNRFGFGGCLADDMGLGKTIQVLALLEERRQAKPAPGPSLVVVPRSLIFNWKAEAARFTPNLRILDHTGVGRLKPGEHFQDYHVILTTYGTLRRDALEFKDLTFDYCILDEAQAVKNHKSESAKAARLIQANHRLAVTGTPVENHLGELWSLFEFLNPGMLGQASVFQLGGAGARNPEPETRALLAKALRPFLLRRTKEQVAKDLPKKTEQTIYAELEPTQRKLYDQLRDHYRLTLLHKIAQDGIAKSKIQILEALLRLRQAACHPGLIDKQKTAEPSAKLDMLLPQLEEVWEEGHKALVFSQFTSFLAILRNRLDKDKVPYEYLDGKTRNRGEKVERFQNDPDCKLFLISLKAGGLGLNLTAAEYVFLLDPWWNPAVEAQAIDRTHRIGQERPVFAYRLIAKDTVEEKVLELQKHKRALADAIINADNSLIRNLAREDLEVLLS